MERDTARNGSNHLSCRNNVLKKLKKSTPKCGEVWGAVLMGEMEHGCVHMKARRIVALTAGGRAHHSDAIKNKLSSAWRSRRQCVRSVISSLGPVRAFIEYQLFRTPCSTPIKYCAGIELQRIPTALTEQRDAIESEV